MQTALLPHVGAANQLTQRWCAAAGSDDFVLAGCAVWPLLALLAGAADGPARSELATAVNMNANHAHEAALRLVDTLAGADTVAAALGLWLRKDIEPHPQWVASLPHDTVRTITDQAALDTWAREHTQGLIGTLPVELTADTAILLASALVARTTWAQPFHDDVLKPTAGPWRGHRGPGLARHCAALRDAALLVTEPAVTRAVVRGEADLDVHLLLGDGPPAQVLGAGFSALNGLVDIHTDLAPGVTGPGLTVRNTRATSDVLALRLPPFEIRSRHDLLAQHKLFGLGTVTDTSHGHLPAISTVPLAVDRACQQVLARFTREGFEAAAVTAMGVAVAAAFHPTRNTVEVAITFDRPFGFLAVHRPTQLVIVAGWVANQPG